MKLMLEPRFLFDGSVVATVDSSRSHTHHGTQHADAPDHAGAVLRSHDSAIAVVGSDGEPGAARPGYVANATQILFVDPRVANWQQLIVGVAGNVQVVVIDPSRSGIDQVSRALAHRQNIQGLQFLTDGTPGAITLGSGTLNAATLAAQSAAIAGWSDHMAARAEIAFWGSDVGKGNAGAAFLGDLHTLTGADIGAASHAVGSADMGGSWGLDAKVGNFDLASPISASALASVSHEILTEIPALAANPNATDLIFIDPRVAGWDQLAAGAVGNAQVTVIDPAHDAISQITAALAGRSGVSAINLVGYGSAGVLELGRTPLDAAGVAAQADAVAGWRSHLVAGANLNLWGCDVAQANGAQLLAELNALTGADVAASTALVGNSDFGGSWSLNTATGALGSVLPFSLAAQAAFTNVLDPANLTTTITADKTTAQSGDIITYTVVVGNPSSHLSNDLTVRTTIALPSNVTFVANSLMQTGGPTAALAQASKVATIATLAPGQTMTFTIQGITKDNLAARTPLAATATTSYTSALNNGSADDGSTVAITTGTIADFTSGLSLVGEANGTAGVVSIAAPSTAANVTIGDIVRVHAYVAVPEGLNSNAILRVALPTGLQFVSDNSTTVALASPSGGLKSSLLDATGTNAALQITEGATQIDPATTAATTAWSRVGAAPAVSAGNVVAFNFGTLTNNDHAAVKNYIIVEFNAIVTNIAANVAGRAALAASAAMTSASSPGTTNSVTYTASVASTPTDLSAANAALAFPLFDSNFGTLTSALIKFTGTVDMNGSVTNTAAAGAATGVKGGVQSTFSIGPAGNAPTNVTDIANFNIIVTAFDNGPGGAGYTIATPGGIQTLNNITAHGLTLALASGTDLPQYQSTSTGATLPLFVKTTTSTGVNFSGGNAITSQTSNASAAISVKYTFTDAEASSVVSNNVLLTVVEPVLTIVKTVTGVDATTGAISYRDVITNASAVTAYGVSLIDPEASSNAGAITGVSGSSTGTVTGAGGTGAAIIGSTASAVTGALTLAGGATETITYTVAVADKTAAVPNSTATLNWRSLKGDSQTLGATTSGTAGSTTGERTEPTGPSGSNGGVNTYTTNVTTGFGAVSGKVWDRLGPLNSTIFGAAGDADTSLAGITVSATGRNPNGAGTVTVTAVTDASGNFSFSPGVFGAGTVTVTMPSPNSNGLSASETLVDNVLANSVAVAATTGAISSTASATGVNFIYQKIDVAPVISNWGGTAIPENGATPVALKGLTATGVADTPLNTLGALAGGVVGGDFGGTVLTVARSAGTNTPNTPQATDVYTGDGTNLVLAGSNVTLGGSTIGTYALTGGTLNITFATGTTRAQVASVLDNLRYNTSATIPGGGASVTITATLNDNNTTLYSATVPGSTGRNLGTTGPLTGTATASVALTAPLTGSISGRVWDVLGPASKTYGAPGDVVTNLGGITVSATYTLDLVTTTVTTTTAADGTYSFTAGRLPDGVAIAITLPAPGAPGLSAAEKLVLQQIGTVGAGAANASVTLSGAPVTNVNFIYQQPDVAPVIANWGGTAIPDVGATPVSLKGALATGVTDTPIATLGGNYGGTILTVGRTGAPVVTDLFSGAGALSLTGGNVVLSGATIGSFTQTGGSLAITFASGTTAAQVSGVLDGLQFASTAPIATASTASITATLNDHNTTLYSALDAGSAASLGRNLGTSGPLSGSAVATVALTPVGAVSGRVWDVLGPASKTYGTSGDVDTNLAGITVTATYVSGGVTTSVTTTTAADGSYTFASGTLPVGTVTISLPTVGSPGLSASETLVLQQIGSVGSGPATSIVTTSATPVSDVNFIYQRPDTAPAIANWGGTAIAESGSTPVGLKGTLGSAVTDTPIAALGGNYGGTILTVGRTGTPVATDLFSGTGGLSLTGGNVVLAGATIGTFTQTGGSLAITFATGTTAAQVAGVLDGLQFSNTAPVTALGQTASITATLNDNNTTLYTSLDAGSSGRTLGTSGPLTGSAVATVALAPAGSISGKVWDTLGPASLTYGAPGDVDTNLGGITVTATYVSSGISHSVTTTTAADGTYTFAPGTLPDGPVTITLPAPGSAGLSAAETLVLQQIGTVGSGPATSVITLAGALVGNVNFIFEKPDLAPVISGWGGTNIAETGSAPVALKGIGAGVTDTPIATLGGNYGGTVLTVQRTGGPNPTDQFGGDGTLVITGGAISLGNSLIGTYTQSGGSLAITFASGISATQVASVLDHLTYSNNAPTATTVSISASLNDRNIISYGGTSPGFDLGTGGPLNSNVVIATIAITPLPPTGSTVPPPILTPPTSPLPFDPLAKFGFGSGNRALIVDNPGRPETWLVGSDVRRFVIANQHAVEQLPPDMFYDTDPAAQLTLDVKQTDGRPLPDWLIFDARGRVFYGTPPARFHGIVDIQIDASDDQGHRATGEYRILVGRDLGELERLLRPPGGMQPLPSLDLRADPGRDAAVQRFAAIGAEHVGADRAVGSDKAIDTASMFAAIKPSKAPARPDFAQQLHDAGRMGRLGQARSLLRSLDGGAQ